MVEVVVIAYPFSNNLPMIMYDNRPLLYGKLYFIVLFSFKHNRGTTVPFQYHLIFHKSHIKCSFPQNVFQTCLIHKNHN